MDRDGALDFVRSVIAEQPLGQLALDVLDAICSASPEAGRRLLALARVVGSRGSAPTGKRARAKIRRFSIERARLMGEVLRAATLSTVSVPESGGPPVRQKRVLYGPQLADGRWLRVVLGPDPGAAFTCVSAYPVTRDEWLTACRQKRAEFPP
ncbi:MAG: hypothetical protein JW751_09855 [Polyangiaceae bacterium]|nr:hypothetical protein [Polyangiaceae bacterium]